MKRLIIILVVLLSLTGCMYQEVTPGDILGANNACAKHTGVNKITAWWTGYASATCNDGYIERYTYQASVIQESK